MTNTAQTGWMPIESAPKDGRAFIAGRFTGEKSNHDGLVQVDRWHDRARGDSYNGLGKFNGQFWPATHWMPLPAAPGTALPASDVLTNANVRRAVMAAVNLGKWLSASLDDPNVCDEMKADIREWFSAGEHVSNVAQALTSTPPTPETPHD